MAYADLDDLKEQISEAKLIQLTDDDDAGVVDTGATTRAVADADALIDGYCGARHSVPFSTVPDIVRKFSVDIAIYYLYGRRSGAPEDVRQRFDDAVAFLKGVARGQYSLGTDDPEGSPPDSTAPEMSDDNPDRIFSRSNLEGF